MAGTKNLKLYTYYDTPEHNEVVAQTAASLGMTKSEMVRQAIDMFLRSASRSPDLIELWQQIRGRG
jgi:hypothetical protein